ncbi:hypothetical protein E2I00_016102 [Balaenoptera physalus]|uniref:Uncharacterized protein n=1 Tax=Balaenoptera physalus TaxID=9770 RepID=A0A643CGQ6_BALPH|nr:hypothetical protein E2I00_016102 [Balaenoptera physalus]
MDAGVPPSLVQLWSSSELNVLTPSLHTVGSSSLEQATDPGGIDTGMLSVPPPAWIDPMSSIQRRQPGRCQLLQQLVACGMMPPLAALLQSGKLNGQKEALWMTADFTARGTVRGLTPPAHAGALEPLMDLLTV